MTPQTVHVAVIDWDGSREPDVYVAVDFHTVARSAARQVWSEVIGEDGKGPSDWPTVGSDLPLTEAIKADPEKLSQWHCDFRDGITTPWVTFSEERVLGTT